MGRRLLAVLGLTPPVPPVHAAAASVALSRPGGSAGWGWASPYSTPLVPVTGPDGLPPWFDRHAAMSLPTIARARNLICSAVAQCPFTYWQADLATTPVVERRVPGPGWFDRPDPDRTRQWLLSWTVDDLLFYGRAHWLVTARYSDSWPLAFRRLAPGELQCDDGRWTVTDGQGGRRPVDPRDVVEFLSPDDGLLDKGYRAVSIALQLDGAADRFASNEVPAGILEEQDAGQEDLSSEELAEAALTFTTARRANTTAAVNRYFRYRETSYDASKMQLVEARTYQALELARVGDVPPYLVGAPAGTGMTYLNGQQSKADLIDFGALPYVACVEQTLSGPNVTPHGKAVRLDLNVFLRNPFTTPPDAEPSPADVQIADPTQEPATPPAEVVP